MQYSYMYYCMALMDNGLDLGNIFRKKMFGFGFGFPVMGRAGFGPEILPREGLYCSDVTYVERTYPEICVSS